MIEYENEDTRDKKAKLLVNIGNSPRRQKTVESVTPSMSHRDRVLVVA